MSESLAVLVPCGATSPGERDAAATRHLRGLTGRSDVEVRRRPSGRPRLEPPYPELGISLSFRAGLMLVGFSPLSAVGADLELDDPGIDAYRMAADHFSPSEAAAVTACPLPDAARDLFFRLWVAKEAALKVTGRGIYDGMDEPDLAARTSALLEDRRMIRLPATSRVPALALSVCAENHSGGGRAYLALATLQVAPRS